MLTRLGPEAAEAIDEFLDVALAYDRDAAPSLQGFVNQLRSGDVEIKRDMEQERDEVRIMTVHGAKGLQAPIVFLPDTCMAPRPQGVRLYPLARAGEPPEEVGHLVWPPARTFWRGGASSDAKRERSKPSVRNITGCSMSAMTRAEDRLYVCGWQGVNNEIARRMSGTTSSRDGLEGHLTDACRRRRQEAAPHGESRRTRA